MWHKCRNRCKVELTKNFVPEVDELIIKSGNKASISFSLIRKARFIDKNRSILQRKEDEESSENRKIE